MKYSEAHDDIADPVLYRLYWSLILPDILHKTGKDATKANKTELHEFHKKELGWDTISHRSHEVVSRFLLEVVAWWAIERGIFICASKRQKEFEEKGRLITDCSFLEVKDIL